MRWQGRRQSDNVEDRRAWAAAAQDRGRHRRIGIVIAILYFLLGGNRET